MTTEDHIKTALETLQLALEREQELWKDIPVEATDPQIRAAVYAALGAVQNAVLEVLGEPELEPFKPEPEEQ